MSSKSCGNAFRQFVDKVKSNNIVQKQHELQELISGPLGLTREKHCILETDEAETVLARIDPTYSAELKRNVEGIFYEEVERANILLDDLDSSVAELQVLLDTILQRIQHENHKCQDLALALTCYEDARSVLVFLKLNTNLLRLKCSVSIDEPMGNDNTEVEFENGDFIFRLSKLEVSSSLLETTG